ncbi:MFS transporter [Ignatzschineria sp. LJL83]
MSATKKQPIRASLAAFLGTMIEWYDFYIYAFASAMIFGTLFFETESAFIATMASFATFAIGLLVRPIGAVFFGHLGDKIGRKKSLVITLFMMGISTIGIGFLPTYAQIGIGAPVLLIILRIIQGLSVGGEWGGAVLIAAEHAPKNRKTFFASFAQLGSPAGLILATIAFRLISEMDDEALYSYGWRLPFLASFGLLIVGYIVRRSVNESPEFVEAKAQAERDRVDNKPEVAPFRELFTKMPKVILLAIGANVLGIAGFYFVNTFMLSYTTVYLKMDRTLILNVLLVVSFVQFFSQPLSAWIGDKFNSYKFLLFSSFVCIFSPYLMFVMVDTQNPTLMVMGIAITVIFMAGYYSVIAGFLTTLFPVHLRYTAISVAYQFCGAIAGGLTPLIGTALAEMYSGSWMPLAIFYSFISLLTLSCVFFLNPKKRETY